MPKMGMLMATGVVLVAGGLGGYYIYADTVRDEVEAALAQYQSDMPDDQVFRYESVSVGLSGATLSDVRHTWDTPSGRLTLDAARVTIKHPNTDGDGRIIALGSVSWNDAVLIDDNGTRVEAASGSAKDVAHPDTLKDGQLPISALAFSDFSLTEKGRSGRVTIERFESRGIADQVVGDARMIGLKSDLYDPFSIGEVAATGLDLTELAKLRPDPALPAIMRALSARSAGTVILNDLVFATDSSDRPQRVTLDTLKLTHSASEAGRIELSLDTRGFATTLPAGSDFADLGIDELAGDFTAVYAYDPGAGELAVREVSLAIDGLGKLSGTIAISGVPDIRRVAPRPEQAAMQTALREASISWADAGLMDKAFAKAAQEQGTTVTQLRAQTSREVRAVVDPQTAQSLAAFIEHGGILEVTARPDRPAPFEGIAMAAMLQPKMLREGLNLQVTAR